MVSNDHYAYVPGLGRHVALHITHPLFINALQSIQQLSKSIYIPRGINTEALDRNEKWDFNPTKFKVCFGKLS